MKRFIVGLAALLALAVPSITHAQWGFVVREKTLSFQRIDAAYPGLAYATPLSDGNHPAAGLGIAVAPQDTAIVDVSDLWWKSQTNVSRFPGAGVASDSVWVGTLILEGSASTIDTLKLFRDVSADGVNWTGNDSLAYHLVTGQVAVDIVAAASDSVRPILATTGQGPGQAQKRATISFFAHPGMSRGGITGQAVLDVNFIRFRVALTPGDFAAAGTTNGLRGSYRYPALK